MSLDALLHRQEPSAFERFTANPALFLAEKLYRLHASRASSAAQALVEPSTSVRVICISDTHSQHADLPVLPPGDLLIHAGDLTQSGTLPELRSALEWLAAQPHMYKVFIAGNHDVGLNGDCSDLLASFPELRYLRESSVTLNVRGRELVVYGSPMTPKHGSWPFQYPREQADWSSIPPETDILVTHGPPAFHLDGKWQSGCRILLDRLWRVRPRLHIFGHIHAARGVEHLDWSAAQAAYERICSRRGGWWDILVLITRLLFLRTAGTVTTLVNAASLGGFRDEQRRGALVVDI
ncbi:metallophosphoesterase domain-containing protein 1 [Exidia glandulosa HHB12029]|uniref:Metallophosphoesterase domain-containing protein 1 n=1 Tax=Exidia glandulosa HHB12029 TaxID=1314781 RepID=A0A165PDH9_EXIGL|nr:metallophosphoesterase domain-containing protein 1 [Exidia glandulosa HHB12029]